MTSTLTRRGLVAAAPAAVIAAALPALAAGAHLDGALLALRDPYEPTLAGIAAVSPAHTAAEDAYFAAKQAQPHLDERALRKVSGLVLAERAWLRAVNANTVVIDEIVDTPAHTLRGVILKAQVAQEDSFNLDLAASIVADLVVMGGSNA